MMSAMRSLLACAVLALVALGLSACGGGGGDAAKPTRAQFIATADDACTANNRRTRALNLEISRAAAHAQGQRDLLRRLAPVLERGAGGIGKNAAAFKAAEPPAGDEVKIDLIRGLYDQQTKLARRLAAAAAKGDVAAFQALSTQQDDVVQRARRLSQAYGFKECGSTKSDAVLSKPKSGDA
jgi:hypothetical protein